MYTNQTAETSKLKISFGAGRVSRNNCFARCASQKMQNHTGKKWHNLICFDQRNYVLHLPWEEVWN